MEQLCGRRRLLAPRALSAFSVAAVSAVLALLVKNAIAKPHRHNQKAYRPSKIACDSHDRRQKNGSRLQMFTRKQLSPDGVCDKCVPVHAFLCELAFFRNETRSAGEFASQSSERRRGNVLQFVTFLVGETSGPPTARASPSGILRTRTPYEKLPPARV